MKKVEGGKQRLNQRALMNKGEPRACRPCKLKKVEEGRRRLGKVEEGP